MTDEEKEFLAKELIALARKFGVELKLAHRTETEEIVKVGKYRYWKYKGFWKLSIINEKTIIYLGKNPSFKPEEDIVNAKNRKKRPG